MVRFAFALIACGMLLVSSGCAMCCAPFDYAYLYEGGKVPRDNQCCGRLGSAFDPAGGEVGYTSPVIGGSFARPESSTESEAAPTPAEPKEAPAEEPMKLGKPDATEMEEPAEPPTAPARSGRRPTMRSTR